MKKATFYTPAIIFAAVLIFSDCNGQQQASSMQKKQDIKVGGRCDGCELMYAGMPEKISSVDSSIGWREGVGQRMLITGTVYQRNGSTPAGGVILYYYHTDHTGKYTPRADMNQQASRHGYIRSWVKTDSKGHYSIYTIRPMHYPNETFAAHVHVFIKEPKYTEYYLDEWVFDDDQYLTAEVKSRYEKRGGSGIMHAEMKNGIWVAQHDITCGLNVPGYPGSR